MMSAVIQVPASEMASSRLPSGSSDEARPAAESSTTARSARRRRAIRACRTWLPWTRRSSRTTPILVRENLRHPRRRGRRCPASGAAQAQRQRGAPRTSAADHDLLPRDWYEGTSAMSRWNSPRRVSACRLCWRAAATDVHAFQRRSPPWRAPRTARRACRSWRPASSLGSVMVTARRIVARHVVADADGDQLDGRALSRSPRSPCADAAPGSLPELTDRVESSTGAPSEIIIRMRRRSGRAMQAVMGPGQGLAVDVLLQQLLAHHQRRAALGAAPGRVGGLVDDVAKIVEAAGRGRLARREPGLAGLRRPSRRGW